MRLANATLRGFRNHRDTALEFGNSTNVILGDNGQGKTNILEAISFLCLTKSFYASGDAIVLGFGQSAFEVQGLFVSDAGTEQRVRVSYVLESKEKVYLQGKRRVEPLFSIVGRFPVVILSPEHAPITFGPPSERRKFLDLVMAQLGSGFAEDLVEYRRILKQRNKILFDSRVSRRDPAPMLEPWDSQMIDMGSRLIYRRKTFLEEFKPFLLSSYRQITDAEELPGMRYQPSVELDEAATQPEIVELFRQELARRQREEIQMGTSLVGPHRDEVLFTINDNDLRKYASQGQHKTFLIALKMAEFFFLKEHRGETPIVLFDDVFSELDGQRARRVLHFLGELSQSFITSTTPSIFEETLLGNGSHRKFVVSNGTAVYENV